MKKHWGTRKERNRAEANPYSAAWRDWCEAVLSQVRFQPDHPAIWRELMEHLEDSRADLERLGYEKELAERRALDAMGSAFLVGSAMDQAHHPFWGWLWQATRALLLTLVIAAAVTLCFADGFSDVVRMTRNELRWEEPPAAAERVELKHATLYAAPGEVWEEDGQVKAEIGMWAVMRDPLTAGREPPSWYFTYRDSRGDLVRYQLQDEDASWPESRYWRYSNREESYVTGWVRHQWTLEVTLDESPEWVEISYPAGGDWTLRVDWGDAA